MEKEIPTFSLCSEEPQRSQTVWHRDSSSIFKAICNNQPLKALQGLIRARACSTLKSTRSSATSFNGGRAVIPARKHPKLAESSGKREGIKETWPPPHGLPQNLPKLNKSTPKSTAKLRFFPVKSNPCSPVGCFMFVTNPNDF